MGGRTLALLALLGGLSAAEEPATRHYVNDSGEFSLELPASWEVTTGGGGDAVLLCVAKVPGAEGNVRIKLLHVPGPLYLPRAQAHYERPAQVEQWNARRTEVRLEPLPHLIVEFEDGGADRIAVYAFRRRLCRGIHLLLNCTKADYPRVREPFLKAAQSARSTLGRWPTPPSGYDRDERDGFLYLIARDVGRRQKSTLQRALREAQRDFVKDHGAIERPEGEPAIVLVHARKEDARILSKEAAEDPYGYSVDGFARRFFAVPIGDRGSERHARMVSLVRTLFYAERYGDFRPDWTCTGESQLGWHETITGKRPPKVTASWFDHFQGIRYRLDGIESARDESWREYTNHGLAFVVFFRHGPSKYRKAYDAFLEDYAATGDSKGALARHMLALDQEELFEMAKRFAARKLQPVRR